MELNCKAGFLAGFVGSGVFSDVGDGMFSIPACGGGPGGPIEPGGSSPGPMPACWPPGRIGTGTEPRGCGGIGAWTECAPAIGDIDRAGGPETRDCGSGEPMAGRVVGAASELMIRLVARETGWGDDAPSRVGGALYCGSMTRVLTPGLMDGVGESGPATMRLGDIVRGGGDGRGDGRGLPDSSSSLSACFGESIKFFGCA